MKETICRFIKQELQGWKTWEVVWLAFASLVTLALSVYWKDSPMGIISALTGVISVVCVGKGKRSGYVFGAVNTALYAIISYGSRFYGEVMLFALYFFPMQFYTFYAWTKYMNSDTGEVIKRRMTMRQLVLMLVSIVVVSLVYGVFLGRLGGDLPYVDALSTVTSLVAMMVGMKRYAEQWLLWIVINGVTIAMWSYAFFVQGSESIGTLVMWCVFLVNAIIMYVQWMKCE